MGYENPNISLIDGYGNPLAVSVGTTIPTGTSGLLLAGSDGTNARYISVDTSGRPAVTISSGNITIAGSTGNTSVVGIASDNTANSTAKLPVISALAGTAAPTWTSGNMAPLSVDTAGNLRITGTVTASNPSVSTSGAAAPTSATYIGGQVQTLQSGLTAGNLYPLSLTTGGLLRIDGSNVTQPVQMVDNTSTGALGSLNATVQVVTTGLNTVGFQLAAGTLIGTIVPEISFDGGTTWNSTYFDTPLSGKVSSIVFSSSNTATAATIVGVGGSGISRVRVSAYTSGTANITIRATTLTDPSVLFANLQGGILAPSTAQVGGSVTTAAPTYTTGTLNALSLTTAGALRIDGSSVNQPVVGPTAAGSAVTTNPILVAGSDGTNVQNLRVKTASTAALATDPSLVVALSPNSNKVNIVGNTGATLDATLAAGTAPTNGLSVLEQYNTTLPAPTATQTLSLQSDQAGNLLNFPGLQFKNGAAWNSATTINTLQYATGTTTIGQLSGAQAVIVQLNQTTTLTGGAVTFQGTYDNINWVTIPVSQVISPNTFLPLTNPYTFVANTNQPFLILTQGYVAIRANLTTLITGTGSVTPYWASVAVNSVPHVKSTISPLFNGTTQTLTATVASLTNGSARSSAAVNNTASLYEDVLLFVTITPNTAGTSGTGYVNVFGYGSIDGTNFPESGVGTDAAATLSTPPNLPLLAQLTVNANSCTRANFKYGPFSFCRTFGLDRLPPYWGVVIQNNSGATLAASGQSITYLPVNGQLV